MSPFVKGDLGVVLPLLRGTNLLLSIDLKREVRET